MTLLLSVFADRKEEDGVYLGSNYPQEFVYDARAHVRDQGARSERRLARAVAREDLDARYKAYKNAWVRPKMPDTDSGIQFKALSNRYAWKKEQVRYVFDDPLIRKLIYRTLELERQKEFEMLRDKVKAEKTQFTFASAVLYIALQHYVSNHDVVIISTLVLSKQAYHFFQDRFAFPQSNHCHFHRQMLNCIHNE